MTAKIHVIDKGKGKGGQRDGSRGKGASRSKSRGKGKPRGATVASAIQAGIAAAKVVMTEQAPLYPTSFWTRTMNSVIGRVVKGKVTKIHDFGAFMELEEGVEGLIHVSEISTERVNNPADILSEGQEVMAEINSVDRDERKIGLSLKHIDEGDSPDASSYIEKQGKSTASLGDMFGDQLKKFDE